MIHRDVTLVPAWRLGEIASLFLRRAIADSWLFTTAPTPLSPSEPFLEGGSRLAFLVLLWLRLLTTVGTNFGSSSKFAIVWVSPVAPCR